MILGIYGKAGSGKDTLLQFINEELANRNITIVKGKIKNSFYAPFDRKAFADKVKQVCAVLTDLPLSHFYDRLKYTFVIPYLNITIRELMQKVGEGLRQTVSANLWLLPFQRSYHSGQHWGFVDIRYVNEFEFLKGLGAITIKIVRPNHEEETLTGETKHHASEVSMDNIPDSDFTKLIINTTLEGLKQNAKEIIDLYELLSKENVQEQNLD